METKEFSPTKAEAQALLALQGEAQRVQGIASEILNEAHARLGLRPGEDALEFDFARLKFVARSKPPASTPDAPSA